MSSKRGMIYNYYNQLTRLKSYSIVINHNQQSRMDKGKLYFIWTTRSSTLADNRTRSSDNLAAWHVWFYYCASIIGTELRTYAMNNLILDWAKIFRLIQSNVICIIDTRELTYNGPIKSPGQWPGKTNKQTCIVGDVFFV